MVINARVPLANMFGYVSHLRSMTQGRGHYSMHPLGYEEVPESVRESLLEQ